MELAKRMLWSEGGMLWRVELFLIYDGFEISSPPSNQKPGSKL